MPGGGGKLCNTVGNMRATSSLASETVTPGLSLATEK